jgi:hypothetical protein
MTARELTPYDAACRAPAEAKAIVKVKDIHDKAAAMAVYAKQAKNKNLEADAIEIRLRATRRIDELREAQAKAIGLNKGTAGKGRPKKGGFPRPRLKTTRVPPWRRK